MNPLLIALASDTAGMPTVLFWLLVVLAIVAIIYFVRRI